MPIIKNSKRLFISISILLNIYCWSVWIYSFNIFPSQEARVNNFVQFVPDWLAPNYILLALLSIGVISILFLSKDIIFNKATTYLLTITQIAFTILNFQTLI